MEYSFIKFQIRSYWPHDVTDANSHITFTFQGTMFMLTVLTQLIFLKMKNLKHLSYLSVSLGNMVNTNTVPPGTLYLYVEKGFSTKPFLTQKK